MGKEKIKFSCGHVEERQLYGTMKEREKKKEYFEKHGVCSECYKKQQQKDVLENKNGVEMKYSDFKIVENLGIKSVPGTYNAQKKTILVALPSGYPKTAKGIINHEYAKKLRSWIPRLNPNAKKSMELAASKIEKSTKEISTEQMEKMVREIRRDSELENVLKRVSSVLGYDITEDNPDRHIKNGKIFKHIQPSKLVSNPRPVRKIAKKQTTEKQKQKRKQIKGKDGYKKTTISKKGYCVPESKQNYWIRKQRFRLTQNFYDDGFTHDYFSVIVSYICTMRAKNCEMLIRVVISSTKDIFGDVENVDCANSI